MNRIRLASPLRSLGAAALAALALFAASVPADAAFPGRSGPIAYSSSHSSQVESTGGIFAHGPRRSQGARPLTASEADDSPSYSADGRSIAFSADRDYLDHLGSMIYVMGADGSGVRAITDGSGFDRDPAFSPDGRRVAFARSIGAGRPHVYVVNVDGSGLRQLTSGPFADYEPTFTPDGRRIVFVSNRDHDVKTDRSDIFAMRPDGTRLRVLIDGPRNESQPDVSPSGRRIVFVSNRAGGQSIYVAGSAGRHLRRLGRPLDTCIHRRCFSSPVWSPDEKHIAALYSGTYTTSLVVMRPDGTAARDFATGGTEEEGYGTRIGPPSWGPAPR